MEDGHIISDGALPDTRPAKEKKKDYHSEEVASTYAGSAFSNQKITKLPISVYSQEFTQSCVLHAFYTLLEYEGLVAPSPNGMSQLRAYRKRANYPAPGTAAVDGWLKIKEGQNFNKDAPVVKNHTEVMANAMPKIVGEKLLADFNFFDFLDYSLVPGVISQGKAVAIFIYATDAEWSREYVDVLEPNLTVFQAPVRHAVTLVPRGDFTENGRKWLTVHDSAAFGGRHLRYIPLEFLLKRAYYATQVFPKTPVPTPVPPGPTSPTRPCQINDRGQAVLDLQAFLIEKGYLGPQYLTGFFGVLTAKALLWFQLENWQKFDVRVPQILEWDGKYYGQRTIDIVKNI